MALWGKTDQANNKPQILTVANTDVYGVDSAEAKLKKGVAHPGWVKVTYGKGPVANVTISAGGTGYTNNSNITFTGDGTGAAGTVQTTGGVITGVTLTSGGSGYTTAPTLSVAGGTGANLVATMGGRAGRVHYETLVALKAVSSDASDDTVFPDA
jgi:hypothetical protein